MSENPGKKKTAQQYAKVAEDCVKVGDLAGLDKAIQGLYEIASESSHIGDDVFNATVRTPYYGTIVGTFIIKAKNAFESFINDSFDTLLWCILVYENFCNGNPSELPCNSPYLAQIYHELLPEHVRTIDKNGYITIIASCWSSLIH